jgi:DNA-binding CsgD family transcriptional regulator
VDEATRQVQHVVGREAEVAALAEFIDARRQSRALILTGEAGIGKTTLWEAAVEAARERGSRVLVARASEAETQVSFAALGDLLDGVETAALEDVPAPQRAALDVALLRVEPGGAPPEGRAIALGLLNTLRSLARRGPILVAIDDVQWLDALSAGALSFAARRLEVAGAGFLLARRTGASSALEHGLERVGLERIELQPLTLGATRRLLADRLGLILPRRPLRRIFETARGNPLFVLELGRALRDRGISAGGDELPHAGVIEDMLGVRVAALTKPVRRVLLAVALSGDLRAAQLEALAEPDAVDEALAAGLVVIDGDRVRASHPLLAAAARERTTAIEHRTLHRELAAAATDQARRARHLALAADAPDAGLADELAAVAGRAAARGAITDAVELAEQALRLTPEATTPRPGRLLALAEYLEVAGDYSRLADLLAGHADELPSGAPRVRAHLLLGKISDDLATHEAHVERAWAEAEGNPRLRALVLATKADVLSNQLVRIEEAETLAVEAQRLHGADPYVLYALGWCRVYRGRSLDDLTERVEAAKHLESLDRLAAIRLAFRGRIADARTTFTRLLSLADERGEAQSYAVFHLQLCELELRAGETHEAERLLAAWPEPDGRWEPFRARCQALLAATRGAGEAARLASAAIAASQEPDLRWNLLESVRARGIAALRAHDAAAAAESLRAVWEHMRREGVDEAGTFPVAADLVEALAELGELDEARGVAASLRTLAEDQEHPWGLATADRCDALLRLAADGLDEKTAALLTAAADRYEALGLRFDRARTLLALGRAERRHRKWAAARSSLEHAASAFDAIGSAGWADDARSELERVGGRRRRPASELTVAEQRIAELAAEGLANKEIARELFVSVHTVERHLSHAYAKLGVRSRSQLAHRLAERA